MILFMLIVAFSPLFDTVVCLSQSVLISNTEARNDRLLLYTEQTPRDASSPASEESEKHAILADLFNERGSMENAIRR